MANGESLKERFSICQDEGESLKVKFSIVWRIKE